jgi:hypothetical protein
MPGRGLCIVLHDGAFHNSSWLKAFSGMAGSTGSCTGKSIFVFSGDTLFPRSKPAGNSGPDRKKTGKA